MKIVLIKLGAKGDVLRTTAVLLGLKESYKNPQIYWVTKRENIPIVINNPLIDRVIAFEEVSVEKIKIEKTDIVINLDEDREACKLASALGGTIKGFYLDNKGNVTPTPSAKECFDMSILGDSPKNDLLKEKNEKTYQQLMTELIGISPRHTEIVMRLTEKQKDFAKDFARRYYIHQDDFVVGLNTGSGKRWETKRWSIENTAKLAEILHKELKAKIMLFGGNDEIERNNEIIAQAKAPLIHVGCGNDLFEFPALISLCNVLVTSDTFGLHVALGLKRKVIALMGPTSAAEIELYTLGVKMLPEKQCGCFYQKRCNQKVHGIDTIKVNTVFNEAKNLRELTLSIIITAFKEPTVGKSIEAIGEQKITWPYEFIVSAPDAETIEIAKKYGKKYGLTVFKDPGKGKSYALNLLLKKVKGDILILTDGDTYIGNDAIMEIAKKFHDPTVGVVTGRVVSANPKNTMLGYWSHLLADAGAHRIRKEQDLREKFIEATGYLFAFRNHIIENIPLDVAEDTIIPYLFYEKGYKIKYAEKAIVYVKNPTTIKDWFQQRKRTAKAHETLSKYVNVNLTPRVKTFTNEMRKGVVWALAYPRSLKEMYWTLLLFMARLTMWLKVFADVKMKKQHYTDGWKRIETAR